VIHSSARNVNTFERRQRKGKLHGNQERFLARERLLRHIGERHDTHDVSRMVNIAKTAGYLDQSGQLTDLGQHLALEKFERDEKSRTAQPDVGAGTFILQVQRHSGAA
jgi:hypothetical protein